ncbi:porin [Polynucleobacter paneuropaeus]|nr:porin [Polynucleobacter paneuropaeus]
MKKSLFALAAVGAIAGTAQAQSSVTVYGVLDLGYVGANTRAANQVSNNSTTSPPASSVINSQYSTFADGAESTSRLGFKGNEDLGGGLSAFFTVETALTPNLQNSISASSNTANRQTFAGLKKAGVGQFAFGTQYTTIHNAVAATDPGMQNNMMGNVVYDKFSGIGASQGAQATGNAANNSTSTTSGTFNYSGQQNNTSYTVRANNMLSIASDTFAGFQGNAFYVLDTYNTNNATIAAGSTGYAGGTTNHTGWGLGGNYTWQRLLVTANYQNFTDKNPYVVGANGVYSSGAPLMNGWGGTSLPGTNARDNQQYYAATYDFGILKAYVQYINRKTMDVNNSNMYVARTGQQIGVRSFVTPTIESWASVGTGKYTESLSQSGNSFTNQVAAYTSGASNAANFRAFQLGTNYWLSKRTNLYAIYGQESQSNQILSISTNNPVSYNMNNYAVGLRHTF